MTRLIKVCLKLWLIWMAPFGAFAAEPPPDNAKTLRTRVETYWRAQEQEDWQTVFGLLSPHALQGISEQAFIEAKNQVEKLRFSNVAVGRIETSDDYAWVEVVYFYQPRHYEGLASRRAALWDVWKRENNRYYPVPPELRHDVPALPPRLRDQQEEQALAERCHRFWQAREQQDSSALYELLNPAYRRQVSLQDFLKKRSFYQYLSHQLDWVEVPKDSQQGRGRVSYAYKINDPNLSKMSPREEVQVQDWIKVGGHWYRNVPPEAAPSASKPATQGDQGA